MAKVKDIRDFFNEKAPFYTKLDFDNIGLLVGFPEADVSRIVTALDITDEVIDEARSVGAQLIVSHHPLLFTPLKSVTDDDVKGRKVINMIRSGISGLCMHTNLDTADGGVNDALAAVLGAHVTGLVAPHGTHPDGRSYGISRFCELDAPVGFDDFLVTVKSALHGNGLRYHNADRPVHRLAVCGGAGAGDMEAAFRSGCDTYVTADLKYDHFLWAKDVGMNLIDADHFCTENVVVPVIASWISERFPEVEVIISSRHAQTAEFF